MPKEMVSIFIMNEQFKELDSITEQYLNTEERTPRGLWKLTVFYYGFNGFAAPELENSIGRLPTFQIN